jgi:hypothetical protein
MPGIETANPHYDGFSRQSQTSPDRFRAMIRLESIYIGGAWQNGHLPLRDIPPVAEMLFECLGYTNNVRRAFKTELRCPFRK